MRRMQHGDPNEWQPNKMLFHGPLKGPGEGITLLITLVKCVEY